MSAGDDDARLVAWIDGELDESAHAAIEARLATDIGLRDRLARLREGGRPFAAALDLLLDEAPVERLQASLAALDRQEPPSARRNAIFSRGRLGVAAAIGLFCAGIVAGHYGPTGPAQVAPSSEVASGQHEDWRQAVAEYMGLYTPETFAGAAPSQHDGLAELSAKIGLPLTSERIALANLQFKGAQIFNFEGAPLGQVAYIDPATGPVLFCIIRNLEPDAAMKAETREGFAVASWAHEGRGYMLIGRLPVNQTAELANALQQRF
jgi:anti-sigma factor RsiW